MLSNEIVEVVTKKGLDCMFCSLFTYFLFREEGGHHQSASDGLENHNLRILFVFVLVNDVFDITFLIQSGPVDHFEFSHHQELTE
jgi:hypothetical protein